MPILTNRIWKKFPYSLHCLLLAGGVLGNLPALAHGEETQIEQDRRRLGNSGPLIEQIDPATVRDSQRASEDAAAEKKGDDTPDMSDHLLGNMWGARDWMAKHGISFDIQEVDELWGNATGGTASGADG
ncbi:carbohydrate porin, partial [Acetobacter sp. AAB5]